MHRTSYPCSAAHIPLHIFHAFSGLYGDTTCIKTHTLANKRNRRLISAAQIATMKPGSVIVDLAVEQGGNVEGAVAGEVAERHGVKIVGHRNVPSRLAADTSALFARNLYNFLSAFWDKERNAPVLDEEIGNAIRLTQGGKVVNERLLG